MEPQNEILWELAKKRAGFKKHLISYAIVNAFLWAVWFASGIDHEGHTHFLPWPLWVMLAWGIGLVFNYADAFLFNTRSAIEREYEKLKNQQS